MKSWQLTFGLGAIFAIGILIVALVRLQLPDTTTSTATLDIEIAKAALTSCVVAVVGAVVGALVKAREQRVQAMRLQADVLTQFIQQLGEHYRSVKAIRRRLRSYGLTNRYDTPPNELTEEQLQLYTEAMDSLEKSQLALEDLKIRVEVLPTFGYIKDIRSLLKTMEDYLREILRERDKTLSQIRNKEQDEAQPQPNSAKRVLFHSLVRLQEFTEDTDKILLPNPPQGEHSNYRFDSHFAKLYKRIWTRIGQHLKDLAYEQIPQPIDGSSAKDGGSVLEGQGVTSKSQ